MGLAPEGIRPTDIKDIVPVSDEMKALIEIIADKKRNKEA